MVSLKEIADKISQERGIEVEYNRDYDFEKMGEVYAAVIDNETPNWKQQIFL